MRELRMEPLDIWPVLKRLEPLRNFSAPLIPLSQPKGVQGFVRKPAGLEAEQGKGAASCCGYYCHTIGCIMLDDE